MSLDFLYLRYAPLTVYYAFMLHSPRRHRILGLHRNIWPTLFVVTGAGLAALLTGDVYGLATPLGAAAGLLMGATLRGSD